MTERFGGEIANAPGLVRVQGVCESGDHLVVVLDFSQGDGGGGAVGEFSRVLELVEPFLFFFVKRRGFEYVATLVKKHHQRVSVGREGKSFGLLRHGNGVEFRAGRRGDFDIDGNLEDTNVPFHFLRLLDGQSDLMLGVVVRVGQVEFRGPCTVDPFVKKLVHPEVGSLLDRFN